MGNTRGASSSTGRVTTLVVLAVLTLLSACRRSAPPGAPSEAPPPSGAGAATSPPSADRALDLLAARIAGLPGTPPFSALWQEDACWKDFAGLAGRSWADFDATVLEPMKAWADQELRDARKATATLFYPFGGPDFVTAFCLFPEAPTTILMGLEPVGNLPDLDRASPEWREGFFADLGELASGFLKRGYFITREMNDIYSRGKVDGALPVIAFFLERGGYEVAAVKRLAPGANGGGWVETPYARLAIRPHRPYGVRIDYLKPGETACRSVYYFSCDVENRTFGTDSALYRFLAGFDRLTTFVKSGSYLLHWNNFSILRRFVLDRSLFVLQDDTAVPYRYLEAGGWKIKLFGRYVTPVKDFTNVEQPDLRRAYEDPASSVSPLPFHFGYRWRTQVDNLLLAERPRRPYKIPVLR
jgi:hypothetical protein